jgi:hypothetical protein
MRKGKWSDEDPCHPETFLIPLSSKVTCLMNTSKSELVVGEAVVVIVNPP